MTKEAGNRGMGWDPSPTLLGSPEGFVLVRCKGRGRRVGQPAYGMRVPKIHDQIRFIDGCPVPDPNQLQLLLETLTHSLDHVESQRPAHKKGQNGVFIETAEVYHWHSSVGR